MADKVEQFLGESRSAAIERVLARMQRYVELETPSRSDGHVRVLAGVLDADLKLAGCDVAMINAPLATAPPLSLSLPLSLFNLRIVRSATHQLNKSSTSCSRLLT